MSAPSVSIIIPAYQESDRISSTLSALITRFAGSDAEIIVVDDGSRDDTASVARRILEGARGRVIQLAKNRGKGAAVRAGVLASTGSAVLFMDADLATELGAVTTALDALERADIVVGSRAVPGAVVREATLGRAVMGRVFNRIVRAVTRLDIHDTQCGFKAFRAEVAHVLFSMSRVNRFAFDAELLTNARILGFRVVEVPVEWTAVKGSSIRPVWDSMMTALELVRLALRARPARVRAQARALGWDRDEVAEVAAHGAEASPLGRRRRERSAE